MQSLKPIGDFLLASLLAAAFIAAMGALAVVDMWLISWVFGL